MKMRLAWLPGLAGQHGRRRRPGQPPPFPSCPSWLHGEPRGIQAEALIRQSEGFDARCRQILARGRAARALAARRASAGAARVRDARLGVRGVRPGGLDLPRNRGQDVGRLRRTTERAAAASERHI